MAVCSKQAREPVLHSTQFVTLCSKLKKACMQLCCKAQSQQSGLSRCLNKDSGPAQNAGRIVDGDGLVCSANHAGSAALGGMV